MIFIIASKHPENDEAVGKAVRKVLANDFYEIGRGEWLASFEGTSRELYDRVFPDNMASLPTVGGLIVFGVSGYWGRSPTDTWEWLVNKTGAKGA